MMGRIGEGAERASGTKLGGCLVAGGVILVSLLIIGGGRLPEISVSTTTTDKNNQSYTSPKVVLVGDPAFGLEASPTAAAAKINPQALQAKGTPGALSTKCPPDSVSSTPRVVQSGDTIFSWGWNKRKEIWRWNAKKFEWALLTDRSAIRVGEWLCASAALSH